MKKLLLRICVMLLLVLTVSCEKESLSIENQIINKENEKIFIDGKEYNFVFKENKLGEIFLEKEEDDILSTFIEKNMSMSYYYDSKDDLHLFKNSDEMRKFMVNENKNVDLLPRKSQEQAESKVLGVGEYSTLKLYDGINYQNLILKSQVGEENYSSNLIYYVNLPNLSNIQGYPFNVWKYGTVDDKASSLVLTCFDALTPNGLSTAYAILYRNSNYSNYSFGISTSAFGGNSEYGILDLHKKKMYRKWFKTRYWGNRISSLKHWIE